MPVMRRGFIQTMAVVVCAMVAASGGMAQAAGNRMLSGGTWHRALEVPGTAGYGAAELESVSCASPGNCGAGGYYVDRSNHLQAFVVTERAGRWGRALEVPGTAALNAGGLLGADVDSVSCPSPGNCAAGGSYTNKAGGTRLFVVSEVAGRWGRALVEPGMAPRNGYGYNMIGSVSCPSAGNCAVGGSYHTGSSYQAFVVNQTNGRWGQAVRLSGAVIKASFFAAVSSVSCPSAGNCTASGFVNSNSGYHLFAASEQAGRWGQAVEIPVSPAVGDGAGFSAMSCASQGNCAAGGSYQYLIQNTVYSQPFVVSETGGRWGRAMDVPGLTIPSRGGTDATNAVSCASPGTCTAGGDYTNSFGRKQAFVVSETNGRWSRALPVPGLALLNKGGAAAVSSISCTSPGTCAAGGYYAGSSGLQAFVVSESSGRWGRALPVPGLAVLNAGHSAAVSSMSCTLAGQCAAVGYYADRSGRARAFTVSES